MDLFPRIDGDSTAGKVIQIFTVLFAQQVSKLREWRDREGPALTSGEIASWLEEFHEHFDLYCREEGLDWLLQAWPQN